MESIVIISNGLMTLILFFAIVVLSNDVIAQHRKTRKDIQEVKTRLSRVRKDLNKIENDLDTLVTLVD